MTKKEYGTRLSSHWLINIDPLYSEKYGRAESLEIKSAIVGNRLAIDPRVTKDTSNERENANVSLVTSSSTCMQISCATK
jgi:hypothetical protein